MNLLVTGGAGFIGSHLVERLLAQEHAVTVVDDFNDYYDPAIKRANAQRFANRASLVETDIRDVAKLRATFTAHRPEVVVHLAARAGVRPSITDPRLYTDVNVMGTQNILDLVAEFKVRKLVFASSSSVYGVNQKVPFAETDPIFAPISPYAATKLAGEALAHVYHHLHGTDVCCLRFFTVYGPRQRPDLAIHKFTRAIVNDRPIEIYGDGNSQRDFTHITDILQGILAAIERPLGYQVINLGESRTVQLLELVRILEKAIGKPANIAWQPAQPGDVPITFADISKAKALLGYNPQVSIEDGIADFANWYRQENR